MESKRYTLAAWTSGSDGVRMTPDLIEEQSRHFREEIDEVTGSRHRYEYESDWCLDLCEAWAEFGKFYFALGHIRDAYDCYAKAAEACTRSRDDRDWGDGDECGFPVGDLYKEFMAMHNQCLKLIRLHPSLQDRYEGSSLQKHYNYYTHDPRSFANELREAATESRAWEFGKKK